MYETGTATEENIIQSIQNFSELLLQMDLLIKKIHLYKVKHMNDAS